MFERRAAAARVSKKKQCIKRPAEAALFSTGRKSGKAAIELASTALKAAKVAIKLASTAPKAAQVEWEK